MFTVLCFSHGNNVLFIIRPEQNEFEYLLLLNMFVLITFYTVIDILENLELTVKIRRPIFINNCIYGVLWHYFILYILSFYKRLLKIWRCFTGHSYIFRWRHNGSLYKKFEDDKFDQLIQKLGTRYPLRFYTSRFVYFKLSYFFSVLYRTFNRFYIDLRSWKLGKIPKYTWPYRSVCTWRVQIQSTLQLTLDILFQYFHTSLDVSFFIHHGIRPITATIFISCFTHSMFILQWFLEIVINHIIIFAQNNFMESIWWFFIVLKWNISIAYRAIPRE